MKTGALLLMILSTSPSIAATLDNKIDVGGYAQLRFEDADGSSVNGFMIRRARLDITGKPSDRVLIKVEFSGDRGVSSRLTDTYVQFFLLRKWTGPSVRFGQMKLPFNPEVIISDADRLCPEPAQWQLALFPETRDKGVVLASDPDKLISAQVGAFNGTGIASNDNDRRKDIVGRIQIRPVSCVVVGGSAYIGNPNLPLQNVNLNRRRYGGDVKVDLGNLKIQVEYVTARDLDKNLFGYDVQSAFVMGRNTLVCRYDTFDPKNGSSGATSSVNIGVIHQIASGVQGKLFFERIGTNNVSRAEVVAKF